MKEPTPHNVAVDFLAALEDEIGIDNYREACRRNARETSPYVCASHDFCDANMVMACVLNTYGIDALAGVGDLLDGEEPDPAALVLWNDAWGVAFTMMQDAVK